MIGKNGNFCAINVPLELVIQVSALIVQVFTTVCNFVILYTGRGCLHEFVYVQEKVSWGRQKFLLW